MMVYEIQSMIYENKKEIWFMRFMMSEGFHEMLVKLWKWYVVESMEHEYEHKWEKCIRD